MYEIEIKSLLGDESVAQRLKEKMNQIDANTKLVSSNKQLNHYFIGGDLDGLYKEVKDLFGEDERKKLERVVEEGENFSVRARQRNKEVLLVVKASIDDTTSENGISRIEFEEPVSITLEELDQKILNAGFEYQAKWSREREEYECSGTNVCLDKNAGYGYLAEFEKIVSDREHAENAKKEIYELMQALEVEELMQDRLQRMFDYYNENWPDYYGTDKIFVIE